MNTEELSHIANATSHLSQAAKALEVLGGNDVSVSILRSMSDQFNAALIDASLIDVSKTQGGGKPTDESLPLIFPDTISRIELIHHIQGDEGGRRYVTYRAQGGELSFQDGGRTLKLFVNDSGTRK